MTGIPTRIVPDTNATTRGGTLVNSLIVSINPIKLFAIIVTNTKNALQYLQVHESSTVPADTAVPVLPSIPIAVGPAAVMFQFGDMGIDLDSCVICNSSTAATKTIGAADCQIVAIIAG